MGAPIAFGEIECILKSGAAVLAPAWNCRPRTGKKPDLRHHSELYLGAMAGKFLIPLRDSLVYWVLCSIPSRLPGELLLAGGAPVPLWYRALEPDFSLWSRYAHISDDDAFVDIDAYSVLVYFRSRGWTTTWYPGFGSCFTCRGEQSIDTKATHAT